MTDLPSRITLLLDSDDPGASAELLPLVYEELRALARARIAREKPGQTLQATALVHEAYLRLAGQTEVQWADRMHFLRVAANMMRRILVNHDRDRRRLKRGGSAQRVDLDGIEPTEEHDPVDLVALDDALVRLQDVDPRKVEIVQLRFFAGLTLRETAQALNLSIAQIKREWALVKAWLMRDLEGGRR